MKRRVIPSFIILILGLTAGCTYFTKKDEPPPLPAIEEPKPVSRLTIKGDYFKEFPWDELPKPRKDGSDPDATWYSFEKDDTLESVAEKEMGDPGQAAKLAKFNDLSGTEKVASGEKIVIPNPFIGVESQIQVKAKKAKTFGEPQPFETEMKKGEHYRMVFKTNVDGYLYVFRQSLKTGVTMLFPARAKKGRRNRNEETPPTVRVKAFDPVYIPIGDKGFVADPKRKGEPVMVFLSLRTIPALEALKEEKKISVESLKDVMHSVNEAAIITDGNVHLMRANELKAILGFSLNLDW